MGGRIGPLCTVLISDFVGWAGLIWFGVGWVGLGRVGGLCWSVGLVGVGLGST